MSNEIPTQSATEVDVVSHGISDILQDIRDDPILKQLHAELNQDSSVAAEHIVPKQPSSSVDKVQQVCVCVCVCLFTNQAFFFY